jgi:hypothetical protein
MSTENKDMNVLAGLETASVKLFFLTFSTFMPFLPVGTHRPLRHESAETWVDNFFYSLYFISLTSGVD